MGQYQQPNLDLKGCMLELAQRNSQASVPFLLSNRGYGFLWNNPAVGRVTFAQNGTEWVAEVSEQLDYWVTAGYSRRNQRRLCTCYRYAANDARLRHGILAVQVALP